MNNFEEVRSIFGDCLRDTSIICCNLLGIIHGCFGRIMDLSKNSDENIKTLNNRSNSDSKINYSNNKTNIDSDSWEMIQIRMA